jgi:hypothetical protein
MFGNAYVYRAQYKARHIKITDRNNRMACINQIKSKTRSLLFSSQYLLIWRVEATIKEK